jgi:outer membrane immunogenic protein
MNQFGARSASAKLCSLAAVVAIAGISLGLSAASAADLSPAPAPVYVKAPVEAPFSWTGFYLGASAGGTWGNANFTGTPNGDFLTGEPTIIPPLSAVTSGTLKPLGYIIGEQAGVNWQVGQFVLGLETDFSGWGMRKKSVVTGPGDPMFPGTTITATNGISSDWLFTARPRLGFALDHLLIYGTGGVAVTQVNLWQSVLLASGIQEGAVSSTLTGWTAGGGLEYALSRNWSVKGEYLYVSFPTQTMNYANPNFPTYTQTTTDKLNASIVRMGANYKF